jgi:hypothetical protein
MRLKAALADMTRERAATGIDAGGGVGVPAANAPASLRAAP